jgi:ribosomal protein L15E
MTERRQAARAQLSLACTLSRAAGSPVWAETIDVGEGGMAVRATRPLRPDEIVEFDLQAADEHVVGRARVMRHRSPRVYSLRFETLREPMRERLHDLIGAGHL